MLCDYISTGCIKMYEKHTLIVSPCINIDIGTLTILRRWFNFLEHCSYFYSYYSYTVLKNIYRSLLCFFIIYRNIMFHSETVSDRNCPALWKYLMVPVPPGVIWTCDNFLETGKWFPYKIFEKCLDGDEGRLKIYHLC